MSLINLSVKHGRTFEDARRRLEMTVDDISGRSGALVQRVDWDADRTQAKLTGTGFEADLRVDSESVHLSADIPLLGKLLGSPVLSGIKGMLERNFQKRLT